MTRPARVRRRPGLLRLAAAGGRRGLWVSLAASVLLSGCFSPMQPACAFSCVVAPRRCPAGYLCGEDGLCHRPGATAACTLTAPGELDAGLDGESTRDGSGSAD